MKRKIIFFCLWVNLLCFLSCGKDSVDPANVSTYAGSTRGYTNGSALTAKFKEPVGIAFDSKGNLYVVDDIDNRVRKITSSGMVSTFAGSGAEGELNGMGEAAQFDTPCGIVIDTQDNLYIAVSGGTRICKITPAGLVSTFAGSRNSGHKDGPVSSALFNGISSMCLDADGNFYLIEAVNNVIRKITPAGIVSTLAGYPRTSGGYADGIGSAALFNFPVDIAVDLQQNVYVADWGNHRIRKVTPAGVVTTLAGSGKTGFEDGPAATAQMGSINGIVIDAIGNIYFSSNNCIRKLTPEGMVSTFAGNRISGNLDGDLLTSSFNIPLDLAFDSSGNLYVSDGYNSNIRKIKVP